MLAKALQGGTSAAKTYVDDVFSTYLYTGNGSTQTINNGIDLAGKGGLYWWKVRNIADSNYLVDTTRGATKLLVSNSTGAEQTTTAYGFAFNSNGVSFNNNFQEMNQSGNIYTSWTFRKAPKFFDVVTFTASSSTDQRVSHSLGSAPGVIILKNTQRNDASGWLVYHRSQGRSSYGQLNATGAFSTLSNAWGSTDPTTTDFGVNASSQLFNGENYVAYLFAHDTAADGLIQCGSFTTDGSNAVLDVSLGWEPQWLLVKQTSGAGGNWILHDNMRGFVANPRTDSQTLYANTTGTEGAWNLVLGPSATGFQWQQSTTATYIYIAIRRPNKPPTSGTQVFSPATRTGTGVNTTVSSAVRPDLVWTKARATSAQDHILIDRLRGVLNALSLSRTDAEFSYAGSITALNNASYQVNAANDVNSGSTAYINWVFSRAPGFFDQVCYTGNSSSGRAVSHGLGVAPELYIVKNRTNPAGSYDWAVYHKDVGATKVLRLNTTAAPATLDWWNNTSPTSSAFYLSSIDIVNSSLYTYNAYLFASLPGISKVGSYTGNGGTVNNNGTSQTINCGFSAGARFVLIKRTDNTGDWYVFDSARGIVASNDPYLLTNSTAVEVTTVDAVDADNSGFIVNQTSGTNLNVTNATYIYFAIA